MREKRDIFDRIMGLPLLKAFEPIYKKNKEVLLYLLFGGLTFVVSITSYAVCNVVLGMNELVANVISWILAVSFAFLTNKVWVFNTTTHNCEAFIKQLASFFGGRVATLVIEELILLIFVTVLTFPSVPVKIVAQVIVIVLNYVISKFIVFIK